MWAIWVAAAAIAAPPSDAATSPPAPTAAVSPADYASAPPTPQDWRDRVRDGLRREALTERAEKEQAARDLVDLYEALEKEKTLAASVRQGLMQRLRGRLRRVARRIEAQRRREQPAPLVATVHNRLAEPRFLAQQLNPVNPRRLPGVPPPDEPRDHGEDLLELIQQVIVPASWDINGGPGSIYYYRPLQVLVIRQTSEIHGRIGGAVGQMRGGN